MLIVVWECFMVILPTTLYIKFTINAPKLLETILMPFLKTELGSRRKG